MPILNVTLTTTATQLGDFDTNEDLVIKALKTNSGDATLLLHGTPKIVDILDAGDEAALPMIRNLNELDVKTDNANDVLIIRY
jgi:hypothetical protein